MKKAVQTLKAKIISIVSRHPFKVFLLLAGIILLLIFAATTTIYFGYKNGKLEFEIKKREMEFKKIKEIMR